MGVDYTGIGGVGIEITEEMQEMITEKYNVENDEEVYFVEILDEIGIEYSEAGSGNYSGEARYYFLVEGSKFSEIQDNTDDFIKSLKDIGIEITSEDLDVISDIHMW